MAGVLSLVLLMVWTSQFWSMTKTIFHWFRFCEQRIHVRWQNGDKKNETTDANLAHDTWHYLALSLWGGATYGICLKVQPLQLYNWQKLAGNTLLVISWKAFAFSCTRTAHCTVHKFKLAGSFVLVIRQRSMPQMMSWIGLGEIVYTMVGLTVSVIAVKSYW